MHLLGPACQKSGILGSPMGRGINALRLWEAEFRHTSCCKEESLSLVSSRQTQLVGNSAHLRGRLDCEVGTQRGRSVF